MSQIRSRIVSTGLAKPSRSVSNEELSKFVETSDEWIRTRTGIRSRFLIDKDKGENNSSLGAEASQQALNQAKVLPDEVDFVLYCTATADTIMPNSASRVIGALDLNRAAGVDLNTACTGFVSGVSIADAMIRSGLYKKILVVGAEVMSSFLDWNDRRTCVLFGDGAGAVLMEAFVSTGAADESMIVGSKLYVDFDVNDALTINGGGSRVPSNDPRFNKEGFEPYIKMNGPEVFKVGSKGMAEAVKNVVQAFGVSLSDVKWIVPHQANLRMLEMVAKVLEFPVEKVFVNLDRWGNTTAATIPIALAEMSEQSLLKKGDLIVLDAFGGGFNYGAVLLRW